VTVIGAVGTFRSGKSYLLNRLFGSQKGFQVGSTVKPCTHGIWMWTASAIYLPTGKPTTVILLDTEGLGNPFETTKTDYELFALALMLTSVLIYNIGNTLNRHNLEELQYDSISFFYLNRLTLLLCCGCFT